MAAVVFAKMSRVWAQRESAISRAEAARVVRGRRVDDAPSSLLRVFTGWGSAFTSNLMAEHTCAPPDEHAIWVAVSVQSEIGEETYTCPECGCHWRHVPAAR